MSMPPKAAELWKLTTNILWNPVGNVRFMLVCKYWYFMCFPERWSGLQHPSVQPSLCGQHSHALLAPGSAGPGERRPCLWNWIPKWQQCNAVPSTSFVRVTFRNQKRPQHCWPLTDVCPLIYNRISLSGDVMWRSDHKSLFLLRMFVKPASKKSRRMRRYVRTFHTNLQRAQMSTVTAPRWTKMKTTSAPRGPTFSLIACLRSDYEVPTSPLRGSHSQLMRLSITKRLKNYCFIYITKRVSSERSTFLYLWGFFFF